ncbi:hypothetical protein WA026_014992 [Henosepilachna vigintioctopunctata]|uniref:Uncharacterized protein n=1 Tax=Henosepilachna vigintioctopunctata TaxID=420089 RepID=A0AAW1U1L9_9CUCU
MQKMVREVPSFADVLIVRYQRAFFIFNVFSCSKCSLKHKIQLLCQSWMDIPLFYPFQIKFIPVGNKKGTRIRNGPSKCIVKRILSEMQMSLINNANRVRRQSKTDKANLSRAGRCKSKFALYNKDTIETQSEPSILGFKLQRRYTYKRPLLERYENHYTNIYNKLEKTAIPLWCDG